MTSFILHELVWSVLESLAYSIYDGLREVSADFYVIADVDGQHSVWDALSMFKISQDTGDVVVGSRFVRGGGMGSLKHYFAANIFNIMLGIINDFKVSDKTGGFAVLPRSIVEMSMANSQFIFRGYGDYFISLSRLLSKFRVKVINFPVFYRLRSSGYSKSNFLKMIVTYSVRSFERLPCDASLGT